MFRLGLAWREDGHSDSTSDSEELVTASVLISAAVLLAGKKKSGHILLSLSLISLSVTEMYTSPL